MNQLDVAKFNAAVAAFNVGMIGYGVLEGEPEIAVLNGALLPLNLGLAAKNSRDELRDFRRDAPEKAFGLVYDSALSGKVEEKVQEAAVRTSKEGGRHRRGSLA